MAPPTPLESPEYRGGKEDTAGQHPAMVADLRKVKRALSWQNAAQVVAVIAAVWVGYKVVVAAVLNDAIASNPVVVGHGEAIKEVRTEMREGLAEQRALSIRQLETTIAAGDYSRTGYRAPILDAPLPPPTTKDSGQ